MAKKNRTISLSEDALNFAVNEAKLLFGDNVSAYVNFIIMREKLNRGNTNVPEEKKQPEEPVKAVIIDSKKKNTLDTMIED